MDRAHPSALPTVACEALVYAGAVGARPERVAAGSTPSAGDRGWNLASFRREQVRSEPARVATGRHTPPLPERSVLNDPLQLITRALAGERASLRELVGVVTPPVQARVARVLLRNVGATRRGHVRADVEDIVQHVLGALFADSGRVLKTWDPARGLPLPQYVALIAEREAISILRSKRRNPYTEAPTDAEALEARASTIAPPDSDVLTRQMAGTLLSRLRATLSPLGIRVFERLFCDEQSPDAVCAELGITTDALYAWRTRIRKVARELATELSNECGDWVRS